MNFNIKINIISIENVKHNKFLVIIIDDKFNLDLHANQVILKFTKRLYLS